jgi:hypothetical protein
MLFKGCLFVVLAVALCSATPESNPYASVTEDFMVSPASAALGGSAISNGNGTTAECSPGNLPFDTLDRVSLSYAGFYQNTFSTSMASYSGQPVKDIGISLTIGYIYVPNIIDSRQSVATDDGELSVAKISYFSASKILMRAGIGRAFTLSPKLSLGAGIAINAKRWRLPETGYGIGCDAGITARFPRTGVSSALLLENATSSYIYWNENFKQRSLPHVRMGIGWYRYIPYIYGALRANYATPDLLSNEGINTYTSSETENHNIIKTPGTATLSKKPSMMLTRARLGIEYTIMQTVALRAGYSGTNFGFGGGVYLFGGNAGIDFAYLVHELGGTYQVAVQYAW